MPAAINSNVFIPAGYLVTIVNGVAALYSGANLPIGVSTADPNQEITGGLPISIPSDTCWRLVTNESIPINTLVFAKTDGTATANPATNVILGYSRANSNGGFVFIWPTGGINTFSPPPGVFAAIAFSGSASDLIAGTIPAAREPARTGDVTNPAGSTVMTIPPGTVTDTQGALSNKPAVAVVSVVNLTLSGEQTIDGATTNNSLVLATAQSTPSQNGPWVSNVGAWTRPTWYPSGGTTQSFRFITTLVRLGSNYQGSTWRMTTAGAIIIDTTATTWVATPLALSNTGLGTVTAEAASRSLVSTDNGHTLVCSASPVFTVNASMPSGFGCAAKSTCSFVGGGGVTVTDVRTSGVLNPWCALIQTSANGTTYDIVGGTT